MQPNLTVLFLLKRIDCNDGVASYIDTVISAFRKQGIRVLIVSGPVSMPGSRQRYEAIRSGTLDWIELGGARLAPPGPALLRRLTGIIGKYGVNVISPQGLGMLPLATLLGKLTRRPVVANYHPSIHGNDTLRMAAALPWIEVWKHRLVLNLFAADRFIALSTDIAEFYRRICAVSPRRIAYLPCPINTDDFWMPDSAQRAKARDALDLRPDTLTCVLTGRLNFNKGHDVAVDALRLLRIERPDLDVVCLFPGTGDQEVEIRAHALRDEADACSFRFLGFVPNLRAVYWASDVALLPSRQEGFGMAVAEAMCCGCVPVRTPSGGARDQIIEGKTGYIVPFDDPVALAGRIADLTDPERRLRMSDASARHAAATFDKHATTERTAALYREVSQNTRTRGHPRS